MVASGGPVVASGGPVVAQWWPSGGPVVAQRKWSKSVKFWSNFDAKKVVQKVRFGGVKFGLFLGSPLGFYPDRQSDFGKRVLGPFCNLPKNGEICIKIWPKFDQNLTKIWPNWPPSQTSFYRERVPGFKKCLKNASKKCYFFRGPKTGRFPPLFRGQKVTKFGGPKQGDLPVPRKIFLRDLKFGPNFIEISSKFVQIWPLFWPNLTTF